MSSAHRFNRIHAYIKRGSPTPVPPQIRNDLQVIVWRQQLAVRRGADVQLSPWLKTLLRLAREDAAPALAAARQSGV